MSRAYETDRIDDLHEEFCKIFAAGLWLDDAIEADELWEWVLEHFLARDE